MKFKGKISKWFYVVMISIFIVYIPLIVMFSLGDNLILSILLSIITLVLEIYCISIILRNYVLLKEEYMQVACGFLNKKIYYDNISFIENKKTVENGTAASFDRIEITCKNGYYCVISLIEKEKFIEELLNKNPNIKIK